MGPYLIFDKSFLQSLTADEAIWLESFFMNNITPLFYVETLADLEKKSKTEKTEEELVGILASKSPSMGTVPAVHHSRLVLANMFGEKVEWDHHRPIIGGGEYKKLPDGKITIDFEQFPEFAALERWKAGDFKFVEQKLAHNWREALSNLTFEKQIEKAKEMIPENTKISSMEDAFKIADNLVSSKHNQFIHIALDFLGIQERAKRYILRRWYKTRPQPFNEFAPYASYVLRIDLFFYICLSKGFIAKERSSNKIDLAYLYYLPFCMVFASNDNLHSRIVPFFLSKDQMFIQGTELKSDFKKINDYFSALPENIKERGVYLFAQYPPYDIETLVGKLHDNFLKPWRDKAKNHLNDILKPLEKDTKLVKSLKENQSSKIPYVGPPISSDEADSMTITQRVPAKKGNWVLFPPEVIKSARENRS